MTSSTERLLQDLQGVLSDVEELLKGVTGAAGECASDASQAWKEKVGRVHRQLSGIEEAAKRDVARKVRVAGRYVRENAWGSLGAAAVLGFVAGYLAGRRD